MSTRHPIQPLEVDAQGVVRFKTNKIVLALLGVSPWDLNKIAMMNFSAEDREQFAQLIGYSIDGFSTLSYVSDETWNKVWMQRELFLQSNSKDE